MGDGPDQATPWSFDGCTPDLERVLAQHGRCNDDVILVFTDPSEAEILYRWNVDKAAWQLPS